MDPCRLMRHSSALILKVLKDSAARCVHAGSVFLLVQMCARVPEERIISVVQASGTTTSNTKGV